MDRKSSCDGRRAWRLRRVALVLAAALVVGAAAGCGGSNSSGGGGSNASKVRVAWLFYGPKNDGGYNVSQWKAAQAAITRQFGDRVEQVDVANIPYSAQASQLTQQVIQEGAKLLIDTVAAGQLFTSVCAKYPDAHCIEPEAPGPYPNAAEAFSGNVSTVAGMWWYPEYLMGMTAGLLTKSNTVGFVAPYKVPVVTSSANAYALGCLKVNPACKVRFVVTNDYFNPPAAVQASNTLVNAGADVLHGWTDDPGFCRVAEQRGVRVVGQFYDYRNLCPTAYATGIVWNYEKYYLNEIKMLLDGTWQGHRSVWLKLGEGADVAPWGVNVPDSVKTTVDAMYKEMRAGTNPFVGPITDQSGKVRLPAGQQLTDKFMYNQWTWLVQNIVGG